MDKYCFTCHCAHLFTSTHVMQFPNVIGHWDVKTPKLVFVDPFLVAFPPQERVRVCYRLWWLSKVYSNLEMTKNIAPTHKSLVRCWSIDFADHLRELDLRKRNMLIEVEHLSVGTTAVWIEHATARMFIKSMVTETIHTFAPPRTIMYDSATSITSVALFNPTRIYVMKRKPLISNETALNMDRCLTQISVLVKDSMRSHKGHAVWDPVCSPSTIVTHWSSIAYPKWWKILEKELRLKPFKA